MNKSCTHRYKIVPSRFSGQDLGRWFIIAKLKHRYNGSSKFLCRCECGTIVFKPGPEIKPHVPCIICVNIQRETYVNRVIYDESDFIYGYYAY